MNDLAPPWSEQCKECWMRNEWWCALVCHEYWWMMNSSWKSCCQFAVLRMLLYDWFCAYMLGFVTLSCSLSSLSGLPQLSPLDVSVLRLSLLLWWTSWVCAFLPMFWCSQSFQWMCVSVVSGCLVSCPPGLCLFLVSAVSGCIMSHPPVLTYSLSFLPSPA
jgi:hypothetical protein